LLLKKGPTAERQQDVEGSEFTSWYPTQLGTAPRNSLNKCRLLTNDDCPEYLKNYVFNFINTVGKK
jgi:hypothetical protein